MENNTGKEQRLQSYIAIATAAILLILFLASGIREGVSVHNLRALGQNAWTPVLIIVAMTGAWTFALPASVFFFITPLLFPPLPATLIICAGSVAGTSMGYVAARYIGGPWVERFRGYRITKFLERHSSFATLFAIRVFPSSPHGWINYGAGLLKLPFWKFLIATLLGVGIKAFLYSVAIDGSVGASSIKEALNWQTVTTLTLLTAIALVGHVVRRKWMQEQP